jgi:hypothetical protein
MKRIVIFIFLLLAFAACTQGPEETLTGKWQLIEKGVDNAGTPCPFITEAMEFFPDGTAALPTLPPGRKLLYTTDISDKDRLMLEKRFPVLKGKRILALLPPSMNPSRINWKNTPVPFAYTIKGNELIIEANGWSPSRYKRVR